MTYSSLCFEMRLSMPGVIPMKDDVYISSSFKVPNPERESYIISYEANANNSVVHHMLLFGCTAPFSEEPYYIDINICKNETSKRLIFSWAKKAPKFEYPFDTGMAIGHSTGVDYLVLQMHYLVKRNEEDRSGMTLEMSYDRPTNIVNILRFVAINQSIPANKEHANMDVSCRYQGKSTAYVMAFRVHAHLLSRKISGFRVSKGQVNLLGSANPQWPQSFYKANTDITIYPGDYLLSRCVYDSTGRVSVTNIGTTHMDEMCIFDLMIVTKSKNDILDFTQCTGNKFADLWKVIPTYSKEYAAAYPSSDLFFSSLSTQRLKFDAQWKVNFSLGQVSSVAILHQPSRQSMYTLLVLHRGEHFWNENTFKNNTYIGSKDPISSSTILEVDPEIGEVLRRGGVNVFIMPHGITASIDGEHVWITDVALHQALRFRILSRNNRTLMHDKPDMILGERFVSGNDANHFCKPAKVAVDKEGFIFVADGYCNSRVVHFYPNGTYKDEWGTKEVMNVVHSISIEEDPTGDVSKNMVWVADRENKRIIGYRYNGSVQLIITSTKKGMPIFGVEFNPSNRFLYSITSDGTTEGSSFIFDYKNNILRERWHSNFHLRTPHDFCLGENGTVIFVAELHFKKVIKFSLNVKVTPFLM